MPTVGLDVFDIQAAMCPPANPGALVVGSPVDANPPPACCIYVPGQPATVSSPADVNGLQPIDLCAPVSEVDGHNVPMEPVKIPRTDRASSTRWQLNLVVATTTMHLWPNSSRRRSS